jgi:hypothetical protein
MRWRRAVKKIENDRMDNEKNGASVEDKFTFVKAVGELLREEVWAGSLKGNYLLNLKEQMRMRCLREGDAEMKVRVMLVGARQIGRLGDELKRRQGAKVDVAGVLKVEEENTEKKNMEAVKELGEKGESVDVVVVCGLANSLVRDGKEGERGLEGRKW